MEPIVREAVEAALQTFVNQTVYVHLETTNGAYAAQGITGTKAPAVGCFIRNAAVRFHRAGLHGDGPFRAGLQLEQGWVYAEGLTDWEIDAAGRLLLAGHDGEGRLAVALELSREPFPA